MHSVSREKIEARGGITDRGRKRERER